MKKDSKEQKSLLRQTGHKMKNKKQNLYSLKRILFEEEEADETAEEENEEEPEEEPEEENDAEEESEAEGLSDTIDADIEAVLIDFEASARKTVEESTRLIYENEEEIDMDQFAGEVARLVKNYENLLDMEKMLVDKAKSFIGNRYGNAEAKNLEDKLATQHDIEISSKSTSLDSEIQTPLAVGATPSGE